MSTTTTTTSSTTSTTTTQPPYTTDSDLLERRPTITSLGVTDWTTSHENAKDYINRDLESGWYRQACSYQNVDYRLTPFAPSKMLHASTQLKDLSVFKALELAYEYLAQESDDDVFLTLSKHYAKKYKEELLRVVAIGIDYDWDADGSVDVEERYTVRPSRRLTRA